MTPPTLSVLIARWEEHRRRGQQPTAEELCRDCPEMGGLLERLLPILGGGADLGATLGLTSAGVAGPVVLLSGLTRRHAFVVDRTVGQRDVAGRGCGVGFVRDGKVSRRGKDASVPSPPPRVRRFLPGCP